KFNLTSSSSYVEGAGRIYIEASRIRRNGTDQCGIEVDLNRLIAAIIRSLGRLQRNLIRTSGQRDRLTDLAVDAMNALNKCRLCTFRCGIGPECTAIALNARSRVECPTARRRTHRIVARIGGFK